jgi:hypothetical protein
MLSDGIGSSHERCLLLVIDLRSKRGAVGRDRLADHASLDRGPSSGRSEQGWAPGRQVERDRRGPCERHGGPLFPGGWQRGNVEAARRRRRRQPRPVGALRVEGEGWAIGGHHEQRGERFDRGGCVRNREGGCWSPFTDPRGRHPREHGDREHQHGAFVPKGGPAHAMSLGSRSRTSQGASCRRDEPSQPSRAIRRGSSSSGSGTRPRSARHCSGARRGVRAPRWWRRMPAAWWPGPVRIPVRPLDTFAPC